MPVEEPSRGSGYTDNNTEGVLSEKARRMLISLHLLPLDDFNPLDKERYDGGNPFTDSPITEER